MKPDVVGRAEHLPFDDGSFDVVVCRIAAHHFPDIQVAVAEMARVSERLLVIDDLLFDGEGVEEAHRLRDPTHVRSYTEDEWRELVVANGFEVEQVELFGDRRLDLEPWLDRVEVPPDDRPRILEVRADRGAECADDLANLRRSHLAVLDAYLDQNRVDHEATGLVLLRDRRPPVRLHEQLRRADGPIRLPNRVLMATAVSRSESLAAGPNYSSYFYDVTTGNNQADPSVPGYPATTGWDPVTGLGTPNAANLVPALAS